MAVALVDFTRHQPGAHIGGPKIPLVAQHPAGSDKHMVGALDHVSLRDDLPDLVVKVVELFPDGPCNELRLQGLAGILINILTLEVASIVLNIDFPAADRGDTGLVNSRARGLGQLTSDI